MIKDSDIILQAAKVMFESVHGYHPDLNWDNAYAAHRELYLKYARIAEPIFEDHYSEFFASHYLTQEVGDMTF